MAELLKSNFSVSSAFCHKVKKGEGFMLIRVMYQNNEYGMAKPFLLDELIASGRIKSFFVQKGGLL
jgi:hypothetical protein